MFDLTGKTAWVTGSAQNLGRKMVRDLASQGADVVVSNRSNQEKLDETVDLVRSESNADVLGVQADISERAEVQAAIEKIQSRLGGVDVLVNNAAIRPHRSLDEMDEDEWNNVLGVNLTGAFHCTKAVAPAMKENRWGRIISISGTDAFMGQKNRAHNVTTKAGILGFSRAVAQELAEYNITVNCVVPGPYDTEREKEKYPSIEERNDIWRQRILLDRLGKPGDLSPAVVFLASDEAGYITGQTLHVNGGLFPTMRDPVG